MTKSPGTILDGDSRPRRGEAQDAPSTVTRTLPTADELQRVWRESPRWRGIERGYRPEDVVRLRGTIPVEYSIARITSEKLWRYLNEKPFVNALGALTGNQAMQQVKRSEERRVGKECRSRW